jgi:hypothetical protein
MIKKLARTDPELYAKMSRSASFKLNLAKYKLKRHLKLEALAILSHLFLATCQEKNILDPFV